MKNIKSLTIAVLALFSSSLLATEKASQVLPFIGKREINFMGGSGTGEYLVIKKNGEYILGGCGVAGCFDFSKGKYSNPLPAEDGEKYLIHNTSIYLLKKNGEIKTDCLGDGAPCVSELY